MTTMSAKTTKVADEAIVGTGASTTEAAAGADRAATGGMNTKPGMTLPKTPKSRPRPAVADGKVGTGRKTRTDTKQAQLVAMLAAEDGATVGEIAAAFGWQVHTARGVLYGALKKKLGLTIVSGKVEGRGRAYRIGT